MHLKPTPAFFAGFLALTSAACVATVDSPSPFEGQSASHDQSHTVDAARSGSQVTLGTPFAVRADVIAMAAEPVVEFAWTNPAEPKEPKTGTLVIEQAELCLRSDGYTVALGELVLGLGASADGSKQLRLQVDSWTTGEVIDSDPSLLRANFEAPLKLIGMEADDGEHTPVAVPSERRVRFALVVHRSLDKVSIEVSFPREGALWTVGGAQVSAGPLVLELQGSIAPLASDG